MLFKFLKYLQPTHYFGLKIKQSEFVFPKWDSVPNIIKINFKEDKCYTSKIARTYDQSWRVIHNGYIEHTEYLMEVEDVPLKDNYVFARKYFSKTWVIYILLLRLLSLHNPIKELKSFYKTSKIKRYKQGSEHLVYKDYYIFNSPLIEKRPLITVIIPTLNRYPCLKDVLRDLEAQDYTNIEVIVIDQSEPFNRTFYEDYKLDLKIEYQKEKALWLARNTAIKMGRGNYFLLFDDDSRVENDWISSHIKTLDFFNADISSGVSISKTGAEIPAHYAYFKISDQLDTGNVLVKKEVFQRLGLFDRQFEKQRMGDGEFGLRAYINGCKNISNPYAKRLHLKVGVGGLREMGSWDAFRTKNLFQPRPIPSVLYFYRRYFGRKRSILAILRTVPISIVPYRYKKNRTLLFCSSIIALILSPLILFQILKSWRLASEKIKEGPKIEFL